MKRYNTPFLTFHLPILYPVAERLPSVLTEPASKPLNDLAAVQTNIDRVHLGDGVDARTGLGVKIAIADSGLDLTHADIPAPAEKYDMTDGTRVQRTVLYLGEITSSQQDTWCKTLEVFDEDAGTIRQKLLFADAADLPESDSDSISLRCAGIASPSLNTG